MPGNSFGSSFRITTCGESHGVGLGVIVDGCPPGLPLSELDIQPDLDRRRPGQSAVATQRQETDRVHLVSGVFEGQTTGAPILLLAHNTDMRPSDYADWKETFRPSHADYAYFRKYGIRDYRGGGRASARETWARVAAGAIARRYLGIHTHIQVLSYVEQVGDIYCVVDEAKLCLQDIESNWIRCPDPTVAADMLALIQAVQSEGDSLGGVIRGVIRGVPAGLGEPVFDKLSADLGKAMLSINAVKGFEIGSGFEAARMRGSAHNDIWRVSEGKIRSATNHAGGVLGGVSTGENIVFRVAFKPVASIGRPQDTVNQFGQQTVLSPAGRHDSCVLPRAVPIVDAMAYLVLMDHFLRHKAQNG